MRKKRQDFHFTGENNMIRRLVATLREYIPSNRGYPLSVDDGFDETALCARLEERARKGEEASRMVRLREEKRLGELFEPESIVKHNLLKMVCIDEGCMPPYIVQSESMGGNAGTWGSFPCVGANFIYDRMGGKIEHFGNIQYAPRHLINGKFAEGTFKLACKIDFHSIPPSTQYRVVKTPSFTPATDIARQALEETVEQYNKIYGINLLR
ncbi:TPA: hypothetical protein HA265_05980 [Candidatus Woesearchaeota archaeon]|nr:hypothetical protein [Candidatus Woesearchaeota archaeon]